VYQYWGQYLKQRPTSPEGTALKNKHVGIRKLGFHPKNIVLGKVLNFWAIELMKV